MFRTPFPQLLFTLLLLTLPRPASADGVSQLIDVPAKAWRQEQPIYSRMTKQPNHVQMRITVHFTDEPKNFTKPLVEKLRVLFKYSLTAIEGTKKKLWGDIPYHFYIDASGKLGECRDPTYIPDSNTAYDRDGHITIVLEGNIKDGITPAQKKKMEALILALQDKYLIPIERVGVHKDYAETDCPGPAVESAVKYYKQVHSK
ncbi:MAG: peptidoglycan recognition protein family protein [Bdellovibrionota bacterium]